MSEGVDGGLVPLDTGLYIHEAKRESLSCYGAREWVAFSLTDATPWPATLDGMDPLLEKHLAFCRALAEGKEQITYVVRISCMGTEKSSDRVSSGRRGKTP